LSAQLKGKIQSGCHRESDSCYERWRVCESGWGKKAGPWDRLGGLEPGTGLRPNAGLPTLLIDEEWRNLATNALKKKNHNRSLDLQFVCMTKILNPTGFMCT
jgi:hypothetical protein